MVRVRQDDPASLGTLKGKRCTRRALALREPMFAFGTHNALDIVGDHRQRQELRVGVNDGSPGGGSRILEHEAPYEFWVPFTVAEPIAPCGHQVHKPGQRCVRQIDGAIGGFDEDFVATGCRPAMSTAG